MNPLALTMGDPAGIGGISLKTWLALHHTVRIPVLDDPDRLERLARTSA